eukprot:1998174-Rhodomonas_salina.1
MQKKEQNLFEKGTHNFAGRKKREKREKRASVTVVVSCQPSSRMSTLGGTPPSFSFFTPARIP